MRSPSDKLNVLFLHAQSTFGADSAVHADIMRALDRERFEVHLAHTIGDGREEPVSRRILESIPDVRLRPMAFIPGFRERSPREILASLPVSARFPLDFATLARYCRKHDVRVVHTTDRPRDSAYGVLLAKLVGAKSIVHVHVKWSDYYSALACWAIRQADAVFGISEYVSQSVVTFGKPASQVHTILNGIEVGRFDPDHVDAGAVRRELGIASDVPVIASVSRLFVHKGTAELLRAFALIRPEFPAARLLVVGDETPFSRGFAGEMKQLAHELGVADAVHFTGNRKDVPSVMAACDVFALPSDEEPFGLVFLEAMAMRRPVAAIGNGGTPEVVLHGETGLLSSAKSDVPAFAANLKTLLADPALRARFGENGRRRVLEHFTAERMARDAGRAYTALAGR